MVYAFGFLPMPAHFDDFGGTIVTDAALPGSCRVRVSVRTASLHMADQSNTRRALGSTMLDAEHFPTMAFAGQCAGATLSGELTLHGVTHPLVLAMQRQGTLVTATAILQRRDYAILGLPGLVGQRIRIRLQTELQPAPR